MSFGFIAYHYPAPEHVEEFIGRCHQVADLVRAQPGVLSVGVWATPDEQAVVTTGQCESEQDFRAAFATVRRELPAAIVFDDREVKPRQVHTLLSR